MFAFVQLMQPLLERFQLSPRQLAVFKPSWTMSLNQAGQSGTGE